LMCPGMPILASSIADKIGHIMNFGDGWYGGVFISTMYTLTFMSNDIGYIVREALTSIPGKSSFHQCIADVIGWHQQFPNDWHRTWFELQKKWSSDIGCPDGVFTPFDIDAKINSAYVAMALLYGNGDYTKTLTIAARAGQDADCNPSSAGGVLGTMLGYKKIPAYWKQGLKEAEDIPFKYTDMSLNKVYDIGFKHALQNIQGNGGSLSNDSVSIRCEIPRAVRFEESFPGIYPSVKMELPDNNIHSIKFDFTGSGFVLRGESKKKIESLPDYVFKADLYIDDEKVETASLPTSFITRRHELFWKYALADRQHQVRIEILNPDSNYSINTWDYIVYKNK
jgi:ADP-ribosylglycohydrolase